MNEQNLKPFRTVNEARENGRKGGKRSGEVRRERQAIRQILELVLSMPVTDEAALKDIKKEGLPLPVNPTYCDYVVSSIVIRTARRGTMADLEKLMELLGETPTTNEVTLDKAIELLSGVESVIV